MTPPDFPETIAIQEFIGADLTEAHFIDATLTGSLFHAVDLSAAHLQDTSLEGGTFLNVDCSDLVVEGCRIDGMRIDGLLVSDLIVAYRGQNPLEGREIEGA